MSLLSQPFDPAREAALVTGAGNGIGRATFRTGTDYQLEFPIQAGVIPWLRACARRNGIPIEHSGQ